MAYAVYIGIKAEQTGWQCGLQFCTTCTLSLFRQFRIQQKKKVQDVEPAVVVYKFQAPTVPSGTEEGSPRGIARKLHVVRFGVVLAPVQLG